MVKKILLEGKKIGFSATEVFRKKIEKTEFKSSKDQDSIQTIKTDRLIIRAFRELGDPVGFTIAPNTSIFLGREVCRHQRGRY
jgi:hypothetical protein